MSAPHGHEPKEPRLVKILNRKWTFLAVFLVVFGFSYLTLEGVGMVPAPLLISDTPAPVRTPTTPVVTPQEEGELPTRIEIPSIGVAANISNPNTTNIQALDQALLTGAVRYPGTGKLGAKGNVLIFGHSSYLPVVHNQAYKAFNDIQHLKKGDLITVYGEEQVYLYEVDTVEETNTSEGEIRLDVNGARLTLATCDTFGAKADRFVVTASLVDIQQN